jgi:hypothetical protein
MRTRLAFRTAVFACALVGARVCVAEDADELGKRLAVLDKQPRGTRTPFDLVDSESADLLKKYPDPADQGRIYYQLAHSYGQSGMRRAGDTQQVIDYAQKALACPLDPAKRLRLYVYWGDAIILSGRGRPMYERRAAAAAAYLKGLKEAQQYNIPEKAPEYPQFSMPNTPDQKEFDRQQRARYLELKRIDYERTLHTRRSSLEEQLIYEYTRHPYAATELRDAATKAGLDKAQIDKLMKGLEAEGALKDEPAPKPR